MRQKLYDGINARISFVKKNNCYIMAMLKKDNAGFIKAK